MTINTLSFYQELEQGDLTQFQDEGITTNPMDYYFSVLNNEIVITPKKLFDDKGRWSDSGYVAPILTEAGHLSGFSDLCESIYESDISLSEHEIRLKLALRGFKHNPELHNFNK